VGLQSESQDRPGGKVAARGDVADQSEEGVLEAAKIGAPADHMEGVEAAGDANLSKLKPQILKSVETSAMSAM